MGGQTTPPKQNVARDYKQGLKVYLKFAPQLLAAEQRARQTYDPQRIQEQLGLQQQFGPAQYAQQLQALQQLDPQGVAVRNQLGSAVSSDLASGYALPKDFQTELESQIRGSEAVRGNELGNAPIAAEDLYKGQAMQQLYQQHLQNAGNFLHTPTPEQQLLAVQPVTPDRTSQYISPSAPGQIAQNSYQNLLAQWQASGGGQTPGWVGTSGQVVGGVLGAYFGGGPQGAQLGSAAGNAAATGSYSYFSDSRAKNSIEYVGLSPMGIPIAEFCYNDCRGRYRGCIAQDVLGIKPDAVSLDPTGLWRVDYSKLDIQLEEIPDLAVETEMKLAEA